VTTPDRYQAPSSLPAQLAALLSSGYTVIFTQAPAGAGYIADLTGPLGSQATGRGGTLAGAVASVWPLGDVPSGEPRQGAGVSSGPFETERQARETPAVRAVHAAFDISPGAGRMAPHNRNMLDAACTAAGVDVGAFDDRILGWLATWEPTTCAVIAGLITRARAAGEAAGR
jgi:hypothetical protein